MATITKFEDLEIWKLAREQAKEIYKLEQAGTFSKDFDLKNQINGQQVLQWTISPKDLKDLRIKS